MVVQGFGKVGSVVTKLLHREGVKVIAISEMDGGIFNSNGLNPVKVEAHKVKAGSVVGYKNADSITNRELLELKCDLLIPAVTENQITEENAPYIKAKIIVEAANGPTTPAADRILNSKDIFLVPDILANAGGITVSYFEWVQGTQSYFWTERDVNLKLRGIISKAFNRVLDMALNKKVGMRSATLMLAVDRVAQAIRLRELYP